jgi:hypothetical protein
MVETCTGEPIGWRVVAVAGRSRVVDGREDGPQPVLDDSVFQGGLRALDSRVQCLI